MSWRTLVCRICGEFWGGFVHCTLPTATPHMNCKPGKNTTPFLPTVQYTTRAIPTTSVALLGGDKYQPCSIVFLLTLCNTRTNTLLHTPPAPFVRSDHREEGQPVGPRRDQGKQGRDRRSAGVVKHRPVCRLGMCGFDFCFRLVLFPFCPSQLPVHRHLCILVAQNKGTPLPPL